MKSSNPIVPAITGTSLMTLYSYLLSMKEEENYSEPELLGQLEEPLLPAALKQYAPAAGWASHYAVGFLFMLVYRELLNEKRMRPTTMSGAVFGAVSGLAGVLAWKVVFKLHRYPPRIPYKRFYGQLVPAHIVFGVVAALTLQWMDGNEQK